MFTNQKLQFHLISSEPLPLQRAKLYANGDGEYMVGLYSYTADREEVKYCGKSLHVAMDTYYRLSKG